MVPAVSHLSSSLTAHCRRAILLKNSCLSPQPALPSAMALKVISSKPDRLQPACTPPPELPIPHSHHHLVMKYTCISHGWHYCHVSRFHPPLRVPPPNSPASNCTHAAPAALSGSSNHKKGSGAVPSDILPPSHLDTTHSSAAVCLRQSS